MLFDFPHMFLNASQIFFQYILQNQPLCSAWLQMSLNKPQKITKEKVNPNLAYCRNLKIAISIFYPMTASSFKMPPENIPDPFRKVRQVCLPRGAFAFLAVLSTRNPGLQRSRHVLSLCNRVLPCKGRLGWKTAAAAGLHQTCTCDLQTGA